MSDIYTIIPITSIISMSDDTMPIVTSVISISTVITTSSMFIGISVKQCLHT